MVSVARWLLTHDGRAPPDITPEPELKPEDIKPETWVLRPFEKSGEKGQIIPLVDRWARRAAKHHDGGGGSALLARLKGERGSDGGGGSGRAMPAISGKVNRAAIMGSDSSSFSADQNALAV